MNELEQLYPSKRVPLYGDVYLHVTPIPLSKIPEIIVVLQPLLDPDNTKLEVKEIAAMVAKHSAEMLPLCIDIPLEEVPIAVLPELLDYVLEQNFPLETLKKWVALGKKVLVIKEAIQGGKPKAEKRSQKQ